MCQPTLLPQKLCYGNAKSVYSLDDEGAPKVQTSQLFLRILHKKHGSSLRKQASQTRAEKTEKMSVNYENPFDLLKKQSAPGSQFRAPFAPAQDLADQEWKVT